MSIGPNEGSINSALSRGKGTPRWHANYHRERAASLSDSEVQDSVRLVRRYSADDLPEPSQWRNLKLAQKQLHTDRSTLHHELDRLDTEKLKLRQEWDRLEQLQKLREKQLSQVNKSGHNVKHQLKEMSRDLDRGFQAYEKKAAWKALQLRGLDSPPQISPQQLLTELRDNRDSIQRIPEVMQHDLNEMKHLYQQVKSHLRKKFWHDILSDCPFADYVEVSIRDEHGWEQEVSLSIQQVKKYKASLPQDIRAREDLLRALRADVPARIRELDLQIQELERMVEPPLEAQEPADIAPNQPQPEAQSSQVSGLDNHSNAQPKTSLGKRLFKNLQSGA